MKKRIDIRPVDNLLQSIERRDFIKKGAQMAVIAASLTPLGCMNTFSGSKAVAAKKSADLIYLNGKVYTSNKEQKWAQAFAVSGDKFLKIGSNEEIQALRTPDTQVVDLRGHLVLPGLIDDHMHPDMAAENYFNIQVDEMSTTYEEFKALIQKELKENPEKEWVFGGNIDYLWDDGSDIKMFGKPSHKSILDEIVSDKPAFFWEVSGHAALVNSKALEVCGITKDSPDPEGGHYVKDKNGEPTGVLRELAAHVVWEKYLLTQPSSEYIGENWMKPAFSYLNSFGLTSISDVWARENFVKAYNDLDKKGDLSVRIAVFANDEVDFVTQPMKDRANKLINNIEDYNSKQVSMIGVKYILDGAAAGQTAVLVDPYEGSDDYRGPWRVSPEVYKEKLFKFDAMGLSVSAHCAGDGAARLVLDCVEELHKKPGNNAARLRHCAAHCAMLQPDDIPRFAELGVQPEFSPVFWYDMPAMRVIEKDIGKDRVQNLMYQIRRVMETGAHVSIGTDWAVTPADPWVAIETVVTRRAPGATSGPDLNAKDHAISLEDAIHLYTMGSAYGQHRENEIGSIEPGKYADFIVTDQNIFEVPIHKVHETKVLSTVLGGRDVYISKKVQEIIDMGDISGEYSNNPTFASTSRHI
ncbi:MAG: amidohydrolase [Desulfobacterales bacterium]|nr:amidohydrolase [Desulfobacterales bacterium]